VPLQKISRHLLSPGTRIEKEQFSVARLNHLLRLVQIVGQTEAVHQQLIVFAILAA
jgi:hypothetical protein